MATAAALVSAGAAPALAAPSAAAPGPSARAATPGAPTAEVPVERLIVGYRPGAAEAASNSAAGRDATAKGRRTGKDLGFDRRLGTGAALVDLGDELDADEAAAVMAAFRADPDVAYVVPDRRVFATAVTPDDTRYSSQWDLFESTAGMNVPAAWDKATGRGVKVAVIDTGYVAHSDLAANVVSGYDFISDPFISQDGGGRDSNPADPGDWTRRGECGVDETGQPWPRQDLDNSWHGTHVAGTIAAVAGNGKGIAGIAHDATVQPVRVLGRCGGTTADIIDAITWASGGSVQGVPSNPYAADVINMSLGGPGSCDSGTQSAINAAVGRGTTVVVAAGNDADDAAGYNPGNCDNVITVAAGDRQGNRAYYSNYGSSVDITAPGGETAVSGNGILSTLNTGTRSVGSETYVAYQGTSMAAPHIAGLAALMLDADPSLTPARIESTIKSTARPLPGSCSGGCGAGLADAAAALGVGGTTTPPAGPTVFSNGTNVGIPDNGTWVTSSVQVTGIAGNAPSDLEVAVDIKHPYRGDLVVEIVAPSGASLRLKEASNDSGADLVTTYGVDASGVAANGTWKLRVADAYPGDTGYIDSWSLTF